MNRKLPVKWLCPLLGTASTLLVCALASPAQAEFSQLAIDPDDAIAEPSNATDDRHSTAPPPKSMETPAIELKEITDAVAPVAIEFPAPTEEVEPVAIDSPELPETNTEVALTAAIAPTPDPVEADVEAGEGMSADRPLNPPNGEDFEERSGSIDLLQSQPEAIVVQRSSEPEPTSLQAIDLVGEPLVHVQGAVVVQGDETSARARLTAEYAFSPNVLIGTTIDLTTGDAFVDSESEGLNVNELYVAASPAGAPNLRLVAGMVDLTSYFDRNSFAKDGVTHFFNPVFQTNPALAAVGIGSRPTAMMIWQVNDAIELKAATFSSSRNLDEFAFDGFAGEIGIRLGDLIVRGTYSSDRDDGQNDGFREIFSFERGSGRFGLESDDREQAYGLNAEWFSPDLNLGLFGRYGRYENLELDRGGDTFSFGLNLLDLFMPDDRLGLAYGRQLSNRELRQDEGADLPDVVELFYDTRLTPNLRAGASFQQRDAFSETILGLRIRADFDLLGRQ